MLSGSWRLQQKVLVPSSVCNGSRRWLADMLKKKPKWRQMVSSSAGSPRSHPLTSESDLIKLLSDESVGLQQLLRLIIAPPRLSHARSANLLTKHLTRKQTKRAFTRTILSWWKVWTHTNLFYSNVLFPSERAPSCVHLCDHILSAVWRLWLLCTLTCCNGAYMWEQLCPRSLLHQACVLYAVRLLCFI